MLPIFERISLSFNCERYARALAISVSPSWMLFNRVPFNFGGMVEAMGIWNYSKMKRRQEYAGTTPVQELGTKMATDYIVPFYTIQNLEISRPSRYARPATKGRCPRPHPTRTQGCKSKVKHNLLFTSIMTFDFDATNVWKTIVTQTSTVKNGKSNVSYVWLNCWLSQTSKFHFWLFTFIVAYPCVRVGYSMPCHVPFHVTSHNFVHCGISRAS